MSKDPLVGQVLHDTHEIVRLIGQGGMGEVYEAVHKRLRKQRFAVKVLHAKMVENEKIFARFQREAEIATEIGHPSIVYVTDFYEIDGRPCMVMEYLEGEDLSQLLAREGKLPPAEVLRIMEQVGSALQAVHDKGVIHRDMKPANIFMVASSTGGEPRVKVLDFGISKIRDSNTGLTGDHSVLGTPHYMSPEQGEGQVKDVDHRTDIFALGTICYQMLAGSIPFDGPTLPGVIYKICHVEPEPITTHVQDLPPAVHRVLQRALAKRRRDRYQRASEFIDDLRAALEGRELLSLPQATPVAGAGIAAAKRTDAPRSVTGPLPRETAVLEDPGQLPELTLADEVQELELQPKTALSAEQAARHLAQQPTQLKERRAPRPATLNTLSETSGETAETTTAPPVKRSRGWIAPAAVGAVVLLAVALVVALRYQNAPDRFVAPAAAPVSTSAAAGAAPTATAPPAAGAVTKPPAAPAPAQVAITLQLSPAAAQVRLNGRLRTDNPLMLRTGQTHHLRVEAPGHLPREQELHPTAPATLKLTLVPKQVPLPSKKIARSPRPRRPRPRRPPRKTGKAGKAGKALPFAGDLDEGKRARPKPKKTTPFSGDL